MSVRWIGTAAVFALGVSAASACGGNTDSDGASGKGGSAGSAGSTGGNAGTGAVGGASGGAGGAAASGGIGGSAAVGGQSGSGGSGGTNDKTCGGLAGTACAPDEYCDFPDNAFCGGDDSTGVCVKKPEGCSKECTATCGCDGKSYCNACLAHMSGTDTNPVCVGDGGTTKVCGGSGGAKCAADEYCDFPVGCGAPGSTGSCQKKPQGCDADCPGVCGCDGKFYCNACSANLGGVDTGTDTSCSFSDAGAGTICSSDWECGPGLKCCYPCGAPGCPNNQCTKPEANGLCPMYPGTP